MEPSKVAMETNSSASSSSEVRSETTESDKTSFPSNRGRRNNNTFRGNNRHKPYPQRNPRFPQYNNADRSKINQYLNPEGFMTPMSSYFTLQIIFDSFEEFCRVVFETLRVRESRSVQYMTRDQFVHAMKLCLFFKYYYYGYISGMFSERQLIDDLLIPMKEQINGTTIPIVIVDFIECIGTNVVNFVTVRPFIYSLEEFFNEHNIFFVLDPQGNQTEEPCTFDNFMEQYTLGTFSTSFVRVKTILHCLRSINMDELTGKPEMLIDAYETVNHHYRAKSHFSLSESVGQRGTVYQFWNAHRDRDTGDYHQFEHRFEGRQFNRSDKLRQMISDSITIKYDSNNN